MFRSNQSLYEKSRTRFTAAVFAGDLLLLVASLLLGHVLRFQVFGDYRPTPDDPNVFAYWFHYCLALLLYVLVAHNQHMYRWSVMLSRARSASVMVKVAFIWSFSVVGVALMLKIDPQISRFFMVLSTLSMMFLIVTWRWFMHTVLHHTPLFERSYRRMAIVGTNADAQLLADKVRQGRCDLHRFAGFIRSMDTDSGRAKDLPADSTVLGNFDELESLMKDGGFDSLTVVDVDLPRSQLVKIAKLCEQNYIDFKAVPKSFEVFTSCLSMFHMAGLPMMGFQPLPQNRTINRMIKRVVDLAGATFGLMLSAPVFAVLIPLIKRESPGPIFYKQIRVGQGGKEFQILKLRSMRVDAEASGAPGWSTQDDPRRTAIGTFMRKWNLDELPQFWNVLIGQMSLVGPRPERPELISDFIKEIPYYQSRHSVKPGMTGWAQVNGLRGDTSIAERIRYDLHYIENWSVWHDLTIKIKTFFNYKGAC